MAKSCLSCRYLQELPLGDRTNLFCTRAPPTVEVLRGTTPPTEEHPKGQNTMTLLGWYPPMPNKPCGEHNRAWWRLPKKLPAAPK